MHALLQSLFYGDFFPLLLLSVILYVLGARLSGDRPACIRYLQRAWYAAFIAFGTFAYFEFAPRDAFTIVAILVRGLLVAGMVAGVTGIFLPALLWLNRTFIEEPRSRFRAWRRRRQIHYEERARQREQRRVRKQRDAEWERDRPQRERDAVCRMQQEIEKALLDLGVRRRALLAQFVHLKPHLDTADWDESTFLNFDWYSKRIQAGGKTEVFVELQRLGESMQMDAAIGEVRHQYSELRPIIGTEISSKMFSALVDGIPKVNLQATRTACDEIRDLLAASCKRLAPSYHALQEEQHLDALDAALNASLAPQDEPAPVGTEVRIHRAVAE